MWQSHLDTSTTFGGGFANTSRRDDQNSIKSRKAQTIVPVMIEHLLAATSTEEITIWGFPARIFSLIGIIRNVEETATKVSYNLEDETGLIQFQFILLTLFYFLSFSFIFNLHI